jgi:hypothetical protein
VLRLIIAIVIGLAIAVGGTVLVVNLLSGNGASSNSSVYNYGSR